MNKMALILVALLFPTVHYAQSNIKYPTLAYTAIGKLNIKLPYIKCYGSDSSLFVFGSNHTNNFQDSQIALIKNYIASFKPSVILYEGDGIAVEKTQKQTVETYFEMGLAKFIADSMHIKCLNIEPKTNEKFAFLLSKYKVEDIFWQRWVCR